MNVNKVARNSYNIYVISNDSGENVDVVTIDIKNDITTELPEGYTKYALIGTFETDGNKNIINIYPNKDINEKYLDGSLNGELYDNRLETFVKDTIENKPVKIIEQWGCSKPVGGKIRFPTSFSEIFYVMANGEKIISKDNDGFTVDSEIDYEIDWFAKGK